MFIVGKYWKFDDASAALVKARWKEPRSIEFRIIEPFWASLLYSTKEFTKKTFTSSRH
jgi:hypothetical protein